VLFDSSASRALGYDASVKQLGALLAELGRRVGATTPLLVRCFDQEVEACYDGTLGGFDPAAQQKIIARRPLGASNFEQAFASFAKAAGPKPPRLIVVTDGIATAGATGAALTKSVLALRDAGVERMDMIVAGGIRDEAALTQLTTAGLARDGVVLDLDHGIGALAARLMNATVPRVRVSVPGSAWVWPTELKGMQPGDQALVYAQLDKSHPLLVNLDGTDARATHMSYPVALFTVERPLLERASIGAQIARLEAELAAATDPANAMTLWARIVELSTTHRVLCAETALLVLESEADYMRFHIDRSALTDILSVGASGLELTHRRDELAQLPPRTVHASDEGKMGKTSTDAAGVLGVMRSMEGAHLASIFGRDTAIGNEALDAPPLAGESGGTIGLGNLSGIGRGGGGGYGRGAGGLGGRRASTPDVAPGAAQVRGSLDMSLIRRIVKRHLNEVRFCYERELERKPALAGRIAIQFTIGGDEHAGAVIASVVAQSTMNDTAVEQCVAQAVRRWEFPRPMGGGSVIVSYPFVFAPSGGADNTPLPVEPNDSSLNDSSLNDSPPNDSPPYQQPLPSTPPYEGRLKDVMSLLHHKKAGAALAIALKWRDAEPGDVLALVALGEAYEQLGEGKRAARAYGSIIDLFAGRADMRRFAGERLERVGGELALAIDTFEKAREQRPDHPASHRLLAYALVRAGKLEQAFSTMREGAAREYPAGRFLGVDRILKEDLGLIAAAWIAKEPSARSKIEQLVADAGAEVSHEHTLRFVLNWETDANDVDFHIFDAQGGHAYYAQKQLASGGALYADVTTGYGPECFAIHKPSAYPYRLRAHYYSRGPMGYGMGKLEIIEHDGHGGLRFEERPFVIMVDRATVDLGQVTGSLRK
jgi:tetratricopeptide (TPR) repeat protein